MNSFRQLHQPTSRIIHLHQKDYLFFGGTAYFGLLVSQEYQALIQEGFSIYGLNNGTSRSNNVQLGIYDEGEAVLAGRFGQEDAALFSSGYLAAQAAVKAFARNRAVYYAPNTHQALWIDEKPTVYQSDFKEWINQVIQDINESTETEVLIIANAMDNLKPEVYDFNQLRNIIPSKNVVLILDDSHGLGVVNKNGVSSKIVNLAYAPHISTIIVASLAKGLGTDAGVVLGNRHLISEIKKTPIFMGASPSSPAFIYALTKSESLYDEAFDKLHQNIKELTSRLSDNSLLNYEENFPVFTSSDSNLYQYLFQNEMIISSFPYPLPSSPLLNRIVLSSLHTKADIEKLTDVLQSYV
ncbi:aminotransferase class I/II-fold pyridoxal phosphate-dependent enzyme [Sphingobacterium bovistauri]|uniref:Aminotransferase class I/II-fold pyridoxal phosphate-dependent enzyme n=1 Tax=Sphingobacterium bovistauri TaxID=2781959 RepID=A0ABS7Z3K4_9SPHI|nr:aminotransferase class I/II-fold pyridoxal phosphate-dependent enzyme [Sphingobacterium bovistauri]MCA5004016.1 aminotransferase class I/II-fold pyridoxal phosphate-dependent enzyme [Sphingobacterium bovistauri]